MIMASGSHSTSGTDGTNGASVTVKSSVKISRRGIVNMLKIKKARSKGIVQKVNWNELGQPIGKGSTSLSYFIGSYARRHVPITCSNWRKKDLHNIKEALWDEVKQTFHGIEEEHKEKIISRAGTLHRQFRTRLRALTRDEDGNYSVEPPLLYAHLSTVAPYWKEFVESSTDEVFVEKSKKNKGQAEAMEVRYKKACVGYARIREIIIAEKIKAGETNPVVSRLDAWEYARRNASGVVDDPVTLQVLEDVIAISDQLEEHELTNIGTDDLLARLIPLEYPGRVRAVGWGVTKTSLQKHLSGSEITKLKKDIDFLKNEIKELNCKGYIPGAHSGGSSHMDNFDIDDDVSGDHIDDHDTVLSKDLPESVLPQTPVLTVTAENAVLQNPLEVAIKELVDCPNINKTMCVDTVDMVVQKQHVGKHSADANRVRQIDEQVEGTSNYKVNSSSGNKELWQGHEVNSEFVCLLNRIMHKYPETFEHFTTKIKKLCTMYLNMLCTSLNDLTKISMTEVTSEMIDEYRDVFAYLQNHGLNVSWLVNRLNYIEHIRFSKPLIPELHAIDCRIDDAKSKLEDLQALRMEKMTEIQKAFGTFGTNLALGFIGDDLLSGL